MAIPSWTYPSNSNLGTFSERVPVNLPILVFDTGEVSDPNPTVNSSRPFNETYMFNRLVDSSLLPNYSDTDFFWIKSNGLPQTAWLGQPDKVNKYSPIAYNYVFKFPRDQRTINGATTPPESRKENLKISTRGFFGIAIDGVPLKSCDSGIIATINDTKYTENAALYPIQEYNDDPNPYGPFSDGSGVILSDRKFFYHTDPRFLYEKDPTRHSPIIGYAFDGNPIYGPYGYKKTFQGTYVSNATYKKDSIVKKNNTEHVFYVALQTNTNKPLTNTDFWRLASPTEPFQIMKSSYRVTEVQRANQTMPDGSFIEDYEYIPGLGDLDEHNGIGGEKDKPYKSPEYPGGTYAYFVTVDPDEPNLPRYPYIIGPTYFQEPLLPNGIFSFPGDIKLEVISGRLPPGLRIEGLNIVGTPFEVSYLKTFRFVLRATNSYVDENKDTVVGLSDRTYNITIDGADSPIWVTPPGDLQIGAQGERTESINKILAITANPGDNFITLTSTRNIVKNSLITCKSHPDGFYTPTRVKSIDPRTRSIDLWEGLDPGAIPRETTVKSTIPQGSIITFSTTYTHTNLFVLDNEYVNYQLSAVDNDLATGQNLTYYIPPRGGTLPPGLTLSPNGIISGFTEAILANDQGEYNGAYDMHLYDKFAYDYGVRPYNGFDSFLFDTTVFDYSDETRGPRKLNRYYSFIVRASDGLNYTDRKFRIYVIGDDYFRADTTIMEVGTRTYTADVTPIRKPIWLTPAYLGRRRANNYITTYLDTFDPSTLRGIISYVLDPVNNDGTVSQLPPGMILDQITGEIYGDVPYQPAVTKPYKFTVRAIRYDPDNPMYGNAKFSTGINNAGQNTLKLDSVVDLRLDSLVTGPTSKGYIVPGTIITAIDVVTRTVTLNTNLLKTVPQKERFIFSYVVSSPKTFTLDIIGEIDSTIKFTTAGDLGEISANFISELVVEATTTVPNAVLNYTLVGGKLPPGLTLVNDGTIQGKVTQYNTGIYKSFWIADRAYQINDVVRYENKYYIATAPNQFPNFSLTYWIEYSLDTNGLTTFDANELSIDKFTTSIDRDFKFIVLAKDQFDLSAVTKIFNVSVITPNDLLYSNIYVKPFLKTSKRLELTDFFTNPDVFELDKLYRPSDLSFGVQDELKMLLYAGIETKAASEYAAALGRSYKKRFRFGKVKKAIAKTPGTNNVVYESVYIEILDNLEPDTGKMPVTFPISYIDRPPRSEKISKGILNFSITDTYHFRDYVKYNNKCYRVLLETTGRYPDDIVNSSYFLEFPEEKIPGSKGTYIIQVDSIENLHVNYPVNSIYVEPGTFITEISTNEINKNLTEHFITIDKPISNTIPNGTNLIFYSGGVTVDQARRDQWDSDHFTKSYTRETVPVGTLVIPVTKHDIFHIGDFVTTKFGNYFERNTYVTFVDILNNKIYINKPLDVEIPEGMELIEDKDVIGRIWLQDKVMSADFDGQLVSDRNKSNIFVNNTTNIRQNIRKIGETERNFLPLWMRTPQSFSGIEQGFTRGIVLCYALPGYGDYIVNNIKNYTKIYKQKTGIDFFSSLDFTVDRIIIDSVKGESGDKYIAFAAREVING